MKLAKKAKKRANTQKIFPWQRLPSDAPEWEVQYVASLVEGLNDFKDIYELITGLTYWLGNVAKMERERQGRARIILPGGSLN